MAKFVEITPNNDSIKRGEFIVVNYEEEMYWALFKCPCGCGDTVNLPLKGDHDSNWNFKKSKNGRPTLSPSVWRTKGCKSHFWVKNGMVKWCQDSGQYSTLN